MTTVKKAFEFLGNSIRNRDRAHMVSFAEFLDLAREEPERILRNVFQVFHDMVKAYVGEGYNEYPDDPESIGYLDYDFTRLLVEGSEHPFFPDRILANRFMNQVEAFKSGAQQNKIYIFDGPPGCGKSTFLNNLLRKFEEYANTEAGMRYEVIWRLDASLMGGFGRQEAEMMLDRFAAALPDAEAFRQEFLDWHQFGAKKAGPRTPDADSGSCEPHREEFFDVACPSHDHPVLMIPKESRRSFLEILFDQHPFREKLASGKEYEWVLHDSPCTICIALYQGLLEKLHDPQRVFGMIHARPYVFNRRLGEGVSVFNPGDIPLKQRVMTNPIIQRRIGMVFDGNPQVEYKFSNYARTNNGIYALMDIKSHNTERLIELHNIITEGVHKVDHIEENVDSLFLAVMNPEDRENLRDFPSFSDRIQYIDIPYVLDLRTEVEIYRAIFGQQIDHMFLPRVLHNFARVIISTRLSRQSRAIIEWIGEPSRYYRYCDENLLLLKIDLYTGYIPPWLSEEDRKTFRAKRRRKVIAESFTEGKTGLSGRDSIKIFNEFFSAYARDDSLINMSMLRSFFTKNRKDLLPMIPPGFLDSLIRMYDYHILQEVKESIYYYNEDQISREVCNYLVALTLEPGSAETSRFTGDRIDVSEDYLIQIENRLLGGRVSYEKRTQFRRETLKAYTSRTLTQEVMVEGKPLTRTDLYRSLYERHVHQIKQKALDPFLDNENFRRAITDFGTDDFKTYDQKIRDDVGFLIRNLQTRYKYTERGAKEVCMYVIDNELARTFATA